MGQSAAGSLNGDASGIQRVSGWVVCSQLRVQRYRFIDRGLIRNEEHVDRDQILVGLLSLRFLPFARQQVL